MEQKLLDIGYRRKIIQQIKSDENVQRKVVSYKKQNMQEDNNNPDALLLRSQQLTSEDFNSNLKCVGRAGAGTNNIPLDEASKKGVVVFNTPGANANAVKELIVSDPWNKGKVFQKYYLSILPFE